MKVLKFGSLFYMGSAHCEEEIDTNNKSSK